MSGLSAKLPAEYDQKLALLNGIVKQSLEKLLEEAKKRDILMPPYGRPTQPTPLLTEEDLIKRGGFSENASQDVPVFKYDYGFNPLTFLANVMKWSHPDSVAARANERKQSQERLEFRAKHAMRQMKTRATLKNSTEHYRSGIQWGPLISPLNPKTVVCVCKAFREGEIITQISKNAQFTSIELEMVIPVHKPEQPVKFQIHDLKAGNKYYIRCCLRDKGYKDPDFPLKQELETPPPASNTTTKQVIHTPMSRTPIHSLGSSAVEIVGSQDDDSKLPVHLRTSARFTGLESCSFQLGEFWTIPSEYMSTEDDPAEDGGADAPDESEQMSQSMEDDSIGYLSVDPMLFMIAGLSSTVHEAAERVVLRTHEDGTQQRVEGVTSPSTATAIEGLPSDDSLEGNSRRGARRRTNRVHSVQSHAVATAVVSPGSKPLLHPDCRYSPEGSTMYIPQLSESVARALLHHLFEKYLMKNPGYSLSSIPLSAVKVDSIPMYSAVVGDVFLSQIHSRLSAGTTMHAQLMDAFWQLSSQAGVFNTTLSLFRRSAFLLAWEDGSTGSKSGLRAEEVLYKQFSHELRKHQRKYKLDKKGMPPKELSGGGTTAIPPPPVLVRPPMSSSLDMLLQHFSVMLREDPSSTARLTYRSLMLGPVMEVFVLDTRNGYLGNEQEKWLKMSLEKSVAPWKIILSGSPFGMKSQAPMSADKLTEAVASMNAERRRNSVTSLHSLGAGGEGDVGAEGEGGDAAGEVELDMLGRPVVKPPPEKSSKDKKAAGAAAEEGADEHTLIHILRMVRLVTDPPEVTAKAPASDGDNAEEEGEAGGNADALSVTEEEGKGEDGDQVSGVAEGEDPLAEEALELLYDDMEHLEEELNDKLLHVHSGIVLITAGTDVPYVAAYDLKKRGDQKSFRDFHKNIYCVEIGVGTVSLTTEEKQKQFRARAGKEEGPWRQTGAAGEGVVVNTDIPYGIAVDEKLNDVNVQLYHGTFMNSFGYYPVHVPLTKHAAEDTTTAADNGGPASAPTSARGDARLPTIVNGEEEIAYITQDMVNTVPPSNAFTGSSTCGFYLNANGILTLSINDLETNESVFSMDLRSLAIVNQDSSVASFESGGILICHVCTTAEKVKVELKKVTGAGCPYAAAWLTHVNLFRKATWHLESLKMETATFNIFGPFRSGYQLQDPSYFYVHHMSMFEHQLHKRVGFGEAARQTFILSNVSYTEECFNYEPSKATEYLALIPFYGGLPPNVTMDLRVKSIGQGNSLVNAQTKALQSMASACSTVRYFGQVIIGVANGEDRALILSMMDTIPKEMSHRMHVVQLDVKRGAHLPFNLLAYGQAFVKRHNCRIYNTPELLTAARFSDAFDICDSSVELHTRESYTTHSTLAKDGTVITTIVSAPKTANEFKQHANVSFYHEGHGHRHRLDKSIRYVYFSEADQIVRFESFDALYGISTASNASAFILPRRREKAVPSDPTQYMSDLSDGRWCGTERCYYSFDAIGRDRYVFEQKSKQELLHGGGLHDEHTYIYC